MSKSKAPVYLATAAAGGIGYYLYNAGGNPKVAEKKFESDVHKASAEVKQHLPGRDPNAEKGIGNAGAQLGAKIDSWASETDKQVAVAKSNAEAYAKEAGLLFFETSAKTAENVPELFTAIAKKLPLDQAGPRHARPGQRPGVSLNPENANTNVNGPCSC